ncbi:uncharacterized protein N7503_004418 [Penicillium pulvis]|uniref:uncharacterized protein n=1 Tax=Penicillium pulvis TaxID=1562058 RepID=UPI002546CA11|nr:uncharacterized protein N7503_004418 [Penicillium pulvis]KAJ5801968.1 hypothetical protein N7503_004418 [Penicillium pulvis]
MPSMSERRLPDMVEGPLIHGMIEVLLQDRIQFPTRLLSRQVLNVLRYFNMSMSQSVDLNAKVIRFMRDAAQPFTSRELSRAHNGFSETENIGVIHYQLSMLVANGAVSRLKIYAYERPNELTYIGPGMSIASQHQEANSDIDGSEIAIVRSQFRSKLQNPDNAVGLHSE